MPLPTAHGLLGAGLVAALHPRPVSGRRATPLLFGALLANAADLDFVLVFALDSKAWHRGFTHSLVFALAVTLTLALSLGARRLREAAAYGLAFASHGVLDFLTSKHGGGVELLWPFAGERLRLGWWGLSEVPSRLPAAGVLRALAIEIALFAPLLLAVILLRKSAAKRARQSAPAD